MGTITIHNLTTYSTGFITHIIYRYLRGTPKSVFDDLGIRIQVIRFNESRVIFRVTEK